MNKITPFVKKIALAVLVLAIGMAALPSISASAAGLDSQTERLGPRSDRLSAPG